MDIPLTKNPMSSPTEVFKAYEAWNMTGRGKSEGHNGYVFFRKTIYWSSRWEPTSRIIRIGKERIVRLQRTTNGQGYRVMRTGGYDVLNVDVPDIGVFSPYEDDIRPDEAQHDRLQYLFLQEAKFEAERRYDDMSVPDLADYADSYKKALERHYKRWEVYSSHCQLNWPPMPTTWREAFNSRIDERIAAWIAPEAVARRERARERAKARKEAKKALGLD